MGFITAKPTSTNPLITALIGHSVDSRWSGSIQYTFSNQTALNANGLFQAEYSSEYSAPPDTTAAFQTQFNRAYAILDDYLNTSFSQTTSLTSAEHVIVTSDDNLDPGLEGFFFYPGTAQQSTSSSSYWSLGVITSDLPALTATPEVGGGEYLNWTLIHEIGHGLGLNHPQDATNTIVNGGPLDNERYTVMSYNGASAADSYGHAVTPMALDIAALQAMYGVETYAQAASTYSLMDPMGGALQLTENDVHIGRAFYAIHDSGGLDTIDYTGSANAIIINLNAATLDTDNISADIAAWIDDIDGSSLFLSLAPDVKQRITDNDYHAGGFFSQVLTPSGTVLHDQDGGFSIAAGTVIENATGSDKADILIGNTANNELKGKGGDDVIHGSGGNDRLEGNAGTDLLFGGGGRDSALYSGASTEYTITANSDGSHTIVHNGGGIDGLDILRDIECATFTDRSIALNPITGPFDVVFLQDLTGSFSGDLPIMQAAAPEVVAEISNTYPGSQFAVTSFRDVGDTFVYRVDAQLTSFASQVQATYASLSATGGGDTPEAQLTALRNAANGVGLTYRADTNRIFILATDAPYQPYVDIDEIKLLLEANDIIPIFAVTSGVISTYEDLAAQLGTGVVVEITSNSSDFSDAIRLALADLNCEVTSAGDNSSNVLAGSDGFADGIFGLGGNDTLSGLGGNDTIDGGSGNDLIFGGTGNDIAKGGSGADKVMGEAGNDHVFGNGGDDILMGGLLVYNGPGAVTDPAGIGNSSLASALSLDGLFAQYETTDIIRSTEIPHVTVSGTGDGTVKYYKFTVLTPDSRLIIDLDRGWTDGGVTSFDSEIFLYGPGGLEITRDSFSSTSEGGTGSTDTGDGFIERDVIPAGVYTVAVATETGALPPGVTFDLHISVDGAVISPLADTGPDSDMLYGGLGADAHLGGSGSDTASYAGAASAVTVYLDGSGTNTGEAAGDTFHSIENLIGSTYSDYLFGDAGNNLIEGGEGTDYMNGRAGFDVVTYGGSSSAIWVDLTGATSNAGAAAFERLEEIEGIAGTSHDDVIITGAGANTLLGGSGNDMLTGGAGGDYLDGGLGFDYARYDGAASGVTVYLDRSKAGSGDASGDSTINIEGLIGSGYADFLFGDSGANYLYGLGGNDNLAGGLGADFLHGGEGFDFVRYDEASYPDDLRIYLLSGYEIFNTGIAAVGDRYESIEGVQGSAKSDTIYGNELSNIIYGSYGSDTLYGYLGGDTLYGGFGSPAGDGVRDTFVFDQAATLSNRDAIMDFEAGIDQIALSSDVFGTDASRIQFNPLTRELVHTGAAGNEYNPIAVLVGETTFDPADFYFY